MRFFSASPTFMWNFNRNKKTLLQGAKRPRIERDAKHRFLSLRHIVLLVYYVPTDTLSVYLTPKRARRIVRGSGVLTRRSNATTFHVAAKLATSVLERREAPSLEEPGEPLHSRRATPVRGIPPKRRWTDQPWRTGAGPVYQASHWAGWLLAVLQALAVIVGG